MKIRFTKWPYGARCAFTTSWDDGYVTDLKVLKVLEKHHVRGTFFISSEFVREMRSEYLDYKQIRDIVKNGHEIGSHGQTHRNLGTMNEKEILSSLITSKIEIEERIENTINGFSYPFGWFNKGIKTLVKLANYKYAKTARFGTINYPPRDWFEWNPSLLTQGRGGYRKKHLSRYFNFINPRTFFMRGFPKDWVELAHYMFKNTYARRGLFYLWGHSRLLCENNDLNKLDMFLSSISDLSDIWFARNIDILRYEMTKRFTSIRINKNASNETEITIKIKPEIEPTVITVEIENPDSSLTFNTGHLSIQKRYQGKKLLVTLSPAGIK